MRPQRQRPPKHWFQSVRSRRWVLVGDNRQLPPFVEGALDDEGLLEAHDLSKEDLTRTLFDRLAEELPADRRVTLTTQHRMVPAIGTLISACFYDGELTSARTPDPGSPPSRTLSPIPWFGSRLARSRNTVRLRAGTTFWNPAEVQIVEQYLNHLNFYARARGERLRVAVISGYAEQVEQVRRAVRPSDTKWSGIEIEAHPIDSFQGQERDVVIYSMTRSNPSRTIGFFTPTTSERCTEPSAGCACHRR